MNERKRLQLYFLFNGTNRSLTRWKKIVVPHCTGGGAVYDASAEEQSLIATSMDIEPLSESLPRQLEFQPAATNLSGAHNPFKGAETPTHEHIDLNRSICISLGGMTAIVEYVQGIQCTRY